MSIYNDLGIAPAINASGKMTALGGSVLSEPVVEAMAAAGREHVVMADLVLAAGRRIADALGADDACPTSGAAAGIAIAVAATIAGEDRSLIQRLPGRVGRPFEIIVQKGHAVDFGAPVTQMIALGGGAAVEVGSVNRAEPDDIAGAVGPDTAAILFVQSHHTVRKGGVSLSDTLRVAREHGLPVILDAAAEVDLGRWAGSGADIVVFSGGKAVAGPTSGILCGSRDLMRAARAQQSGIARSMKVGKEQILGLVAAVRAYSGDPSAEEEREQRERMRRFAERLALHPGVEARVEQDDAGRPIHRAVFTVGRASGTTAVEVAQQLVASTPPMFLRDHRAAAGQLAVDPRGLSADEEASLLIRLEEVLVAASERGRLDAEGHA